MWFLRLSSVDDAIIAPVQNNDKTASPDGRRHQIKTFALATCGLMLAGPAFALGLGSASGQVVIGQPLRIEIPLLGVDAGPPAADCFRIRAPQVTMDPAYVLKGGRTEVVSGRGQARLVVTAPAVREPVVEFAVNVACGIDLTKEYLLLSSLPAKAETAVAPPVVAAAATSVAPPAPARAPVLVAPAAPRPAAAPSAAGAPAAGTLRIDAETTFEALAQRNYPLQPKAREKYARMMREANPGIGGVIAAGTELLIPAGLPVKRTGPYRPEAATPKLAAEPAVALPAATKPAKGAGSKDVLKLGVAPERSNAELLEEAERLTGILLEQARMEDEIAGNLTRLEASFNDLKQQYQATEARLARLEAERQAEKAAAKSQLGIVELVAAVLVGGALGGAGLHLHNRRRRSDADNDRFDATTVAAYLGPEPAPTVELPKPKAKPEKASLSFTGDK